MPTPFLSLLLSVPVAQAPLAPAHLHPAGLDLYVEIPDVGAFIGLTRRAPIGQLVHDPQFLALLAATMRQPELDPAQLAALIDGAMGKALGTIGLPANALDGAELSLSINGLRTTLPGAVERSSKWKSAHDELVSWNERVRAREIPPATLTELPESDGVAPLDPWGRAYAYSVDANTQQVSLSSLGADGAAGGSGDATDVLIDTDVEAVFGSLMGNAFGYTAALRFGSEAEAAAFHEKVVAALSAELGAAGPDGEHSIARNGITQWLDLEGATVLAGAGDSRHADVLARARGGAARNSAGARSVLESAHARLGQPSNEVVWLGYQAAGWTDLLGGVASALTSISRTEQGEMMREMLGGMLPFAGASSAPSESAWRTEFDGRRFRALGAEPVAKSGYAALLGRQPIDAQALSAVPASATAFWTSSVDGSALGDQLFELLAKQQGQSAEEWLATMERACGVRLDSALFDNLAGGVTVYAMPWKAIGVPPVVAIAPLRDPAKLNVGLERLSALKPEDFTELGAKISTRAYRDVPITTFSLNADLGMVPVQPALCVLDGQLFLSTSPTPLKDEIKRRKEGKSEPHAALAGAMKDLSGTTSAYHADFVAMAADLLDIAANVAKMMGGDNLPVDLSKLPKRELLAKYFEPSVSRTQTRDGWSHTTTEGSFGPETPVLLAVMLAGTGEVLRVAPSTDEASVKTSTTVAVAPAEPTQEPAEATTAALRQVRGALAVYKSDRGAYPSALTELSASSANYPRGYLSSGSLPSDGWGGALRYEPIDGGTRYRLWSCGPDGVDQSGASDDVSAQPVK